MNYQNTDYCYYHPKQFLVGVCPFCLNEKLLLVQAKQPRRSQLRPRLLRRNSHRLSVAQTGKSDNNHVGLHKMFAFRSLLNRHRNKRRSNGCDDTIGSDYQSTSTSLEDSFISIKFEDNGVALWEKTKNNPSKTSQHQPNKLLDANTKCTILDGNRKPAAEHPKTPRGSVRWRKRIGHLLQLVRCKRSSKGNGGTSSNVNGVGCVVKVSSKGWIRSFTRRKSRNE